MFKSEISPTEYQITFDSMSEFADSGLRHLPAYLAGRSFSQKRDFIGASSKKELTTLAYHGWETEAAEAMDIANQAVEDVEREFQMPGFRALWDVAGCEVDVARFLAREPENMIDYEIVPTTRVGRVIILCASISYSMAISSDTIRRRGHAIAALAFALNKLGYATELWADLSASKGTKRMNMRIPVKGANDTLDPASIMFAYSHPSMLRGLGLQAMHEMPSAWQEALGVGITYGTPAMPKEDLPDGAIYLPHILSEKDVPEAKEVLIQYLKEIGIVD